MIEQLVEFVEKINAQPGDVIFLRWKDPSVHVHWYTTWVTLHRAFPHNQIFILPGDMEIEKVDAARMKQFGWVPA